MLSWPPGGLVDLDRLRPQAPAGEPSALHSASLQCVLCPCLESGMFFSGLLSTAWGPSPHPVCGWSRQVLTVFWGLVGFSGS